MAILYTSKKHTVLRVLARILHCAIHGLLAFICLLAALSNIVFSHRVLMVIFLVWCLLEILTLIFCFPLKNKAHICASICSPFIGYIAITLYAGIQEHNEGILTIQETYPLELYKPFTSQYLPTLDEPSYMTLEEPLPHIDGITALYPLYASFVQAIYPYDTYEPRPVWNEEAKTAVYQNPIVLCSEREAAYENLFNGTCDILFCTEPTLEEHFHAEERGYSLFLTPIAKDAFVFLENSRNKTKNVTLQQIQGMYSGILTNWKALGSENANQDILLYQQPPESESYAFLKELMGDIPLVRAQQTANYKNYRAAFGYTMKHFAYISLQKGNVSTVSIDGVAPTDEAIRTEQYVYTSMIYAITTGHDSENTKRFIDWILSRDGQSLVQKNGFTKLFYVEEAE